MDNKEKAISPITNHPEISVLMDERAKPNDDFLELFTLAGIAAGLQGHNYLGAEHLIVAFYRIKNNKVKRFLEDAKVSEYDIEQEIGWTVGTGDAFPSGLQLTPRVRRIIENAAKLSIEDKVESFGPEYIFIALLEDNGGVTGDMIRRRVPDLSRRLAVFKSSLQPKKYP